MNLEQEGGLVWFRGRDFSGGNYQIYDTVRGPNYLFTMPEGYNVYSPPSDYGFKKFLDNGYQLGINNGSENLTGQQYVCWSFNRSPGYFDAMQVDLTAGVNTINHNLGIKPGMIWVVRFGSGGDPGYWWTWHPSFANNEFGYIGRDLAIPQAMSNDGIVERTTSTLKLNVDGFFIKPGMSMVYMFAENYVDTIASGSYIDTGSGSPGRIEAT